MYSLELPRWGDSNEYTQHTIPWWNKKKSINICFLELLEEFCRDWKKEFESFTVNEPSVFNHWGYTVLGFYDPQGHVNCSKHSYLFHYWFTPQKKILVGKWWKPTISLVRPANMQISLCIHAVWSESSLISCAIYSLREVLNNYPCHIGWLYRLIFAGHTGLIVGFVMCWLKSILMRSYDRWTDIYIALDNRGYQVNIFHISPCMLWVLNEALPMSTHNISVHFVTDTRNCF